MKPTIARYLKWKKKCHILHCVNVFYLSFFKEKYLWSTRILSRKMHNVVSINVKSLKYLFFDETK